MDIGTGAGRDAPDLDRAPDGRGLRVGAALGLVSAGGAVVAGASFDASTNDFGPWTPYGEGTWTVIGGLSVVAGVVLVRSRPRQWFIPAPALAMGAYGLYHTWIAFPIDGIDLTIFIGGPLLVVVWLMTAVATWAWASDVPTADSVRSDGPASP